MDNKIDINEMKIIVTGCVGFIGASLVLKLLEVTSCTILGIDNINNYYDIKLKEHRLEEIRKKDNYNCFTFEKVDISDKERLFEIFKRFKPDIVFHLAAQAGVRNSVNNPDIYIQSNVNGFFNLLEACRKNKEQINYSVKHFIYASSSSVYGNNVKIPYSELDNTDRPVSLYAATKKAGEIIAYSYSKLYEIPMTGTRFFTVYGPLGRPDMSYYKFTEKLVSGEEISLFNYGENERDYTYISDIVSALLKIACNIPLKDNNGARYQIYNIGNSNPINTIEFLKILVSSLIEVGVLKKEMNIENHIKYLGPQVGDVDKTFADIDKLKTGINWSPTVGIEEGLRNFAKWYKEYKSLL